MHVRLPVTADRPHQRFPFTTSPHPWVTLECYDCYMPERLAHRDLRNRSSEVLREVAAGATYEVTNHGEVVAVLSPPARGTNLRIRKARFHGGFSGLARVRRDQSVQEVLDDLRGEH